MQRQSSVEPPQPLLPPSCLVCLTPGGQHRVPQALLAAWAGTAVSCLRSPCFPSPGLTAAPRVAPAALALAGGPDPRIPHLHQVPCRRPAVHRRGGARPGLPRRNRHRAVRPARRGRRVSLGQQLGRRARWLHHNSPKLAAGAKGVGGQQAFGKRASRHRADACLQQDTCRHAAAGPGPGCGAPVMPPSGEGSCVVQEGAPTATPYTRAHTHTRQPQLTHHTHTLTHLSWPTLLPPSPPQRYVHRVGRTARLGSRGDALLFLLPSERGYVDHLGAHGVALREQPAVPLLNHVLGADRKVGWGLVCVGQGGGGAGGGHCLRPRSPGPNFSPGSTRWQEPRRCCGRQPGPRAGCRCSPAWPLATPCPPSNPPIPPPRAHQSLVPWAGPTERRSSSAAPACSGSLDGTAAAQACPWPWPWPSVPGPRPAAAAPPAHRARRMVAAARATRHAPHQLVGSPPAAKPAPSLPPAGWQGPSPGAAPGRVRAAEAADGGHSGGQAPGGAGRRRLQVRLRWGGPASAG